jgi:hypothetical protein
MHLNFEQEDESSVMIAHADNSNQKQESYEEVDARDYNGDWYQAFIISRTNHQILVHFSGSF